MNTGGFFTWMGGTKPGELVHTVVQSWSCFMRDIHLTFFDMKPWMIGSSGIVFKCRLNTHCADGFQASWTARGMVMVDDERLQAPMMRVHFTACCI